MESIRKGFPLVPQSITNPNVRDENALDKNEALSFIDFIKVVKVSFEPDTLQSYYTDYINKWSNRNNNLFSDNRKIIINRYRDFLKDLSNSTDNPLHPHSTSNLYVLLFIMG